MKNGDMPKYDSELPLSSFAKMADYAAQLQKELDELKASIPHLISNEIHEALDKFGPTNGYHAIDLVDHLEEFADQLTSKE